MSRERVYLVGGAVRDELLGLPVAERDWVVTGSTPEALIRRGYRQVGTSFPVFLHPETAEEYALARTERKQGHGYTGFAVDFHPGVTIEEDLERRDLTINAMARDGERLIDPFGGLADLQHRVLRHVSPAFAEDPLRVLRVARFAARFAPLGFSVHGETMDLMRTIVGSGEMAHLVPERVWSEVLLGLATPSPARFIEVLRECRALAAVLPEVEALFGVPQPVEHHPEIDTGTHLLLALEVAAASGWSDPVRFAILVHDLGKGITDPGAWPAHHDHETHGLPLVRAVCERLRAPTVFRELALLACALHLRFHRAGEMRPASLLSLLEDADLLRRPERLEPLAQVCEADYRGREGRREWPYPQADRVRAALRAALRVRFEDLGIAGREGLVIASRMRQARIEAIASDFPTADS